MCRRTTFATTDADVAADDDDGNGDDDGVEDDDGDCLSFPLFCSLVTLEGWQCVPPRPHTRRFDH